MDSDERLPFDLGREAYIERQLPYSNPYSEDDWRNQEWWLGWNHEEEIDPKQSYDHVNDVFTDGENDKQIKQ